MDPVTAMLLAACLLAYGAKKVVSDTIVDNNYAKQGLVSPRFEAQHGREVAAKTDKYGFTDFLRDNWRDYWAKAADARIAARDVQPKTPGAKVRWSDRWAAAKGVMARAKVTAATAVKKVIDPVESTPKPEPIVDPTADADAPADGTTRFTDDGREQYDAATGDWAPVPDQPTEPTSEHTPRHSADPSTGGTMNDGAAAEANNYEAAIRQLDALAKRVAQQKERAALAKRLLDQVDDLIDAIEKEQKAIAAATQQMTEALQGVSLDASTLTALAQVTEALDAKAIDEMIQHLEQVKQKLLQVIAACDAAAGALAATRSSIVSKYGDAAQTVSENLRGDSRFLQAEGTAGAPAPARHAA